MKSKAILFSAATVLAFRAAAVVASADTQANWPQWRGPLGNGSSPSADPPVEWSETKNVKWKVGIPGEGDSTPVIWGNQVFVLTAAKAAKPAEPKSSGAGSAENVSSEAKSADANPPGAPGGPPRRGPGGPGGPGRGEKPTEPYQFTVLCYDRGTGKLLWQKVAKEEVPHEGHQPDNTFASASPVTDGEVVLAYFGSRGLYCYDMQGNLKWSKDFGDMITRNGFGEGASPALSGDVVVLSWDDETENDFIVALDRRTGKELWRKARNEPTGWTTPFIIQRGEQTQVVVNATGKVRSYELTTGKELWSCSGMGSNPIPTPVADDDTVYVMSGHREPKLLAISLGRTGDLTDTDAVRWTYNRSTPYVPSPVWIGGSLYFISGNTGKLSCFDAKTGKPNFEAEQLEGIFGTYASPVTAKDRIYVLGREGKCAVLKQGAKLETLATNKLDDRTDASIALAGSELFIRGKQNLYCIAEK